MFLNVDTMLYFWERNKVVYEDFVVHYVDFLVAIYEEIRVAYIKIIPFWVEQLHQRLQFLVLEWHFFQQYQFHVQGTAS